MLTQIAAPADNERGPRYMERALAAMHQAHHGRQSAALLYGSVSGQVGLFVRCGQAQREQLLGPIAANYPHCSLTEVAEDARPDDAECWAIDLVLTPELLPILRHAQFEDALNHLFADPVSGLLRAIKPDESVRCFVEIVFAPATHRRCHAAFKAVKVLDRQFFRHHHRLARFYARHRTRGGGRIVAWLLGWLAKDTPLPSHTTLETSTSRLHEREEDLQAAADKIGGHLFDTSIRLIVYGRREDAALAHERLRSMIGALGAFTRSRLATFRSQPMRRNPQSRRRPKFLLSHEELATLWHPPTSTALAERMKTTDFRELEAPSLLRRQQEDGTIAIGRVRFRDDRRLATLSLEDRRRHLYVVGKTGMGKTTLLQNMIVADLETNRGLCLVDPHGDLADAVAGLVPSQRTNEVIYFDAANRDCAVGFNPLACRDPDRIDQVTSAVVSAFRKIHESWGPRLEDTLRNAVFAVVEQRGNLMAVMRLLGERPYRECVVPNIRDEVVRSFWMHEFAAWSDNYRTEAVAAIQNKIRPFLTNTNIRAIVGDQNHSLDFRRVMDEGKVLIVNLSKGRLGEDNATLLGAFLVSSIQQAAMTRADQPETERRDFYLYVDEFQNFTTGSFASVLSEARKYRLGLIVANQYLAQLTEQTAEAVFGNVGSIVAFQVGASDAKALADQIGKHAGQIAPENLTGLPKYTAYARLLIDGMPSNPFSMETLAPSTTFDAARAEIVRRVTKRQYANGMQPAREWRRNAESATPLAV